MKYRFFHGLDTHISEIAIGTWGLDTSKWPAYDFKELVRAYALAFELGVNYIDTARGYLGAEQTINKVLKEIGIQDIIVATKIAPVIDLPYPISASQAFPYDHIIQSTDDSLRALNRDTIDLQQFHIWDPTWVSETSWLDAVDRLKRAGKIRAFGVSLYDHAPETAVQLVQTGLVDSIQLLYNIFDQSPSFHLFNVCLQDKVSVIVRSPLYEGILSGKVKPGFKFDSKDWRNLFFSGKHLTESLSRAEVVKEEFVDKYTLADLSLKFCLSHPAVSTVLVGMRTADHVWSNCQSSGNILLTPKDISQIKKHNWMSSLA